MARNDQELRLVQERSKVDTRMDRSVSQTGLRLDVQRYLSYMFFTA